MKLNITFLVIIILSIIGLLTISGFGYYYWKRAQDIKNIKKNVASIANLFCGNNSNKYADCYVNKMIDKYGYVRIKEINNNNWNMSVDELIYSTKLAIDCKDQYC
jgi:hypothetical protein